MGMGWGWDGRQVSVMCLLVGDARSCFSGDGREGRWVYIVRVPLCRNAWSAGFVSLAGEEVVVVLK